MCVIPKLHSIGVGVSGVEFRNQINKLIGTVNMMNGYADPDIEKIHVPIKETWICEYCGKRVEAEVLQCPGCSSRKS